MRILLAYSGGLDTSYLTATLAAEGHEVVACTVEMGEFIDFDDGGFGYRLFEVATALLKHRGAADYAALAEALIEGYRAERELDATPLPLFMALRAVVGSRNPETAKRRA